MKKITDKEYIEYQEYKRAKAHGRILTPDGLKLICESNDNNPEAIGKYMLKVLYALENTPDRDIVVKLSPDILKCFKSPNKGHTDKIGYNPFG